VTCPANCTTDGDERLEAQEALALLALAEGKTDKAYSLWESLEDDY
jgi:hypothetical protein